MSSASSPSSVSRRSRFRFFAPILAGATWRDRIVACLGALIGVGATGLICGLLLGNDPHLPLLVAPMGASALLLFAIPSSPLAQPWSIIGGNTVSALIGLLVGRYVPEPAVAAGLAVALAIAGMSLLRCLHPPGGAAALTAALGGPIVAAYGLGFAIVPVGLNAVVLTGLGVLFHRFSSHRYPHRAQPATNSHGTKDRPSGQRVGFNEADIDAALSDVGEAFDIDREDLDRLLRRVELHALARHRDLPRCADIMSRDLVRVDQHDDIETARRLLLDHAVRTLPVVDRENRVLGTIGLRELTRPGTRVHDVMSPAVIARPDEPAIDLIATLTNGRHHAVIVVDEREHLVGLVSQSDLLAMLLRPLRREAA
ncbi:CBS domain-containing membrane protein [Hyphomicrobiales bacterium]|nr:CBS domain-containing membrane protein [Hyphomicrobiales bacterium]CAH1697578.1 CBS domain-containing membrane protein [Hyphomicrobiales bacterium]CAI0347224.1 CBS domain-containing membrane protein [Hyphomicrobiales bacterium]